MNDICFYDNHRDIINISWMNMNQWNGVNICNKHFYDYYYSPNTDWSFVKTGIIIKHRDSWLDIILMFIENRVY